MINGEVSRSVCNVLKILIPLKIINEDQVKLVVRVSKVILTAKEAEELGFERNVITF